MKKGLLLAGLAFVCLVARGQDTNVTATVVDSDGTAWANGLCSIYYLPVPASPGPLTDSRNGSTIAPNPISCSLDASGHMAVQVIPTAYVYGPNFSAGNSPGIQVSACPAMKRSSTTAQCYSTGTIVVSGATLDVSSQVNAAIVAPRVNGLSPLAQAYNDTEVIAGLVNHYFRITDGTERCFAAGVWGACGTGGGGGGGSSSGLLAGCGIEYVSGLTFNVGACTYKINNIQYQSILTSKTLATADPTNPRIDLIGVDNTGSVIVITGTPAATPQEPTINPATQLGIAFVEVPAASSTPSVTVETIYEEGTEWTYTTGINVNPLSTNNPYRGTYDVEFGYGGNAVSGPGLSNSNIIFTKPAAGSINLSNFNNLIGYVLNKAAWPSQCSVNIQWYDPTFFTVGHGVLLTNGVFGFDATNISGYQQIAIPLSLFGTGSTPVGKLGYFVSGTACSMAGFHLDAVSVQAGAVPPFTPSTLMNFKGIWNSTAAYGANDTVSSSGALCVALVANTNVATSTSSTWDCSGSGSGSAAWGSITGTLSSQTDLQSALNLKAPLASPALTGVPTVPTAAPGTNTTQAASTAFVIANAPAQVYPGAGIATSTGSAWGTSLADPLPVAHGGTGTTTPALVAGTGCSGFTGTWPNITINCAGTGGGLPSATSGQFPVYSGSAWIVAPNVVYGQTADTIASIEAQCTSSTPLTYIVTQHQSLTLSGNHSLSSCVNLLFYANGQWDWGSTFTLTVQTPVQGTATEHWPTADLITFAFPSSLTSSSNQQAPVVWWGGTPPDGVTDATSGIQGCVNSHPQNCLLQPGTYLTSSPLTFSYATSNGTGLIGSGSACNKPFLTSACTIIQTASASDDLIDIVGASSSNPYATAQFSDFWLDRTTTPSGAAKGMSFTHVQDLLVERTIVEDNIENYYICGFTNDTRGHLASIQGGWGYTGLTYSTQMLTGVYVDTTCANNASLYINDAQMAAASTIASGTIKYGYQLVGNLESDFFCTRCSTTNMDFASYDNFTGSGGFSNFDKHWYDSIFDSTNKACISVNNASAIRTSTTEYIGGECSMVKSVASGGIAGVDIESSTGVLIQGIEIGNVASVDVPAVYIHNSSHITSTGNIVWNLNGATGSCDVVDTSVSIVLADNCYTTTSTPIVIKNSSADVSVGGIVDGASLTYGIDIDGTSGTVNASNAVMSSTVRALATPVHDLGTNDAWQVGNNFHFPAITVGSCTGCGSSAVFPGTNGFVWNTSTSAARNGTVADLASLFYVADSGSTNAYAATLAYAPAGYVDGMTVTIKPGSSNTTTTPTLNVNGLGAVTITKDGAAALVAGDVASGALATFQYDSAGPRFQLLNPQTVVQNVTGTTPIVVTPSGGTYAVSCPTCSISAGGTSVSLPGASSLGSVTFNGNVGLLCADTSGSGTAQVCTTSPSITPAAGTCFTYTTTTANSGTGLTLNIDSFGVKNVAVASSTGWSTTLVASTSIPANKPMLMCYDGTNLNASGTGVIPGSSTPVPATVGGLEYWFSADRAPGSNSTAFTRWPDPTDVQSVTMISPSQAGATYVTGAVNGQPAISFPGTTAAEFLFGSNALPRVVSTSTTFVVFNTSSVSGSHMFIDGPSNALNVLLSGTHLQLAQANVATVGTDSTTLSASTWYQANSTYNSSTGAFAFRVNEIAGASGTQTSTISVQQSAIGYDPTAVGSFFNGSIAEIIVYNRVLSGGEITTIETYLHTKYGI